MGGKARVTFEEFVRRAIKVHGLRYTYHENSFEGLKNKTRISCTRHGDFYQKAENHVWGKGCKKCATGAITAEEFERKATEVHGGKYAYKGFTKLTSKVEITCTAHGVFHQDAISHLAGSGCKMCTATRLPFTLFKQRAEAIHNGKYSYHEDEYVKSEALAKITCPTHGDFYQKAANHLRGKGCKKCIELSFEQFVEKANKKHSGGYTYSEEGFVNSNSSEKVTIHCAKHGVFKQTATNHLQGSACPRCSKAGPSELEQEIYEFLKEYGAETRVLLPVGDAIIRKKQGANCARTELDVYLPDYKVAVEANGLYWHDEEHVGEHFHQDKRNFCENKGIDLIQIFEDEWVDKQDIVKSILLTRLGKYERKVFARKTEKRIVSASLAKEFYQANHIQGYASASEHVALVYEGEIVAMASFGVRKGLFNSSKVELIRYCSMLNTQVVGGLSKLIKGYGDLKTYCDMRLFNGKGYKACGFIEEYVSKPGYYYVKRNKRHSRFLFQKHKLEGKLAKYNAELTESKNMAANGYKKIFGCGNMVLTRKEEV